MKKLFTMLLCLIVGIGIMNAAQNTVSGTFKNGGTWRINDQGELYVDAVTIPNYKTGWSDGEYYMFVSESLNYKKVGYPYSLERTLAPWGAYAVKIKSIRFSSNVKRIGEYAFTGLTELKSVSFDAPNTANVVVEDFAFYCCLSLTDFDFSYVKEIGAFAFSHAAFAKVTLPAIKTLDMSAFFDCYRLFGNPYESTNGIYITSSSMPINEQCHWEVVESKQYYSYQAGEYYYRKFVNKNEIVKIIVPPSEYSKYNKKVYENMSKPNIYDHYLQIVPGDENWNLWGSVLAHKGEIPDYAQASNAPWYSVRNDIEKVYIANAGESIGSNAFTNCVNLELVTGPKGVIYNVIRIGENAFKNCSKLRSVDAAYLKQIDKSAFEGCSKLYAIPLTHVQTIGAQAFLGCPFMRLTFGKELQSIGAKAFQGAFANGGDIYVFSTAPVTSNDAFSGANTSNTTLHVDVAYLNSYQASAAWNSFRTDVQMNLPVHGSNPTWELNAEGVLTVTGNIPNYTRASEQPWYNYRKFIRKVVMGNNVTSVGNNAFASPNEGESQIKEVEVPVTVTSIGENAFKNNDQIEEVEAEGVQTIGNQAFENCSSLEKVKFGKEVSSMGEKVFNNCGLVDVMAVKSATPPAITARTFEGLGRMSANAPAKVKAKYAARRATSGTGQKSVSLEVPDEHISKYLAAQYWNLFTFEYIGEHGGIVESDQAYDGLYVLYSDGTMIISASAPTDPQNINVGFTISSNAKSKVKRVEIQGLLTKLGHQFNDCPNLEEVVLSGGINSLNGTFNNCPKLKTINLENVQYLKSHQQGNKVIPCFGGCTALQEVNIPNVLEIGDNCFKGCTGLTTVALGGEAEVGMEAFSGCTALKRIALGNAKLNGALQAFQGCTALEEMTYSGTRMPAEIFKGCTALHKINLGGSLKDILSEAFANTSIDSIYVQCPTPPEAAANAFSGITLSSIKVIVPDAFDGPYSSAPVWEEMFTYEDEDYAELDFPIHFAIGSNGFGTVDESGNLTINAMGALVDNFRDYVEPYAPYIIGEIRIGNEVSSLPAGTPYRLPFGWVKEDGPRAIVLGSGLLELGDYALYNNVWDCDLIVDCYALNPPVMKGANVFNWSKIQNGSQCVATLNVVNDAAVEAAYRANTYWKKFSISSGLTPADAPAECTVTFVDWDGTILQQTTTRPGMMVTPPADPVREGYTFKGWDSQEYNWVVSDLTITATYYDETYTVRFYDWDGTLLSEQQVHYGQAAEAPADPAREGYTFLGWSEDFSAVTLDKYIVAMYHNDHEGIEDIQPDQVPNIKVMIDGVIYILRDGKIYNLLGIEVK